MINYIIRRVLLAIPVAFLVSLFSFCVLYFAPGDPAVLIVGEEASAETVAQVRESLGLDNGFFVRFADWLGRVVAGDLGKSYFGDISVVEAIGERLEPTFLLMFMTLALTVMIGIPLGVACGWKPGSLLDRVVMALSVISFSVPSFVFGYALAWFLGLKLGWFPVQGYSPIQDGIVRSMYSLFLPSFSLATLYIAVVSRTARASMIEIMSEDFIRTAYAKGMKEWHVLFIHALKNAGVPIITVIGSGVALLISGAIVTEIVFSVPGIGRLTIDAVMRRDYVLIQGILLVFSIMYVAVNLLVDLSYAVFDPRVRMR